jgi:hypothetical protein
MNINTALYMADILENASQIMAIPFIFGIAVLLFAVAGKLFCLDSDMDRSGKGDKLWSSILKKWWVVALLSVLLLLIPNKKTIYLMMGSTYLQQSNIPTKVSKVLEIKLDEYLEELVKTKRQKHDE